MGFFKNLFGNSENQFIDLVRAHENGEEWATAEIQKMWESNDSTLLPSVCCYIQRCSYARRS